MRVDLPPPPSPGNPRPVSIDTRHRVDVQYVPEWVPAAPHVEKEGDGKTMGKGKRRRRRTHLKISFLLAAQSESKSSRVCVC